jgi:membrane protease YdiL (CAAX protease family)
MMDTPPADPSAQPTATLPEAAIVVAICFGLLVFWSMTIAGAGFEVAGAFTDAAFLQTILLECSLAAVALWYLALRGYSVRRLLPSPTWWGTVLGALLCAACLLAWNLVGLAISPGDYAAAPIARAMAGSRPSVVMVVAASVVNALYEETFLVGYLLRGFAPFGAALALGLSVLVRLLYHAYQGPVGALAVVVFGLVVGVFYWRTRLLWPVAAAHAMQDIVAFAYPG